VAACAAQCATKQTPDKTLHTIAIAVIAKLEVRALLLLLSIRRKATFG